MKIPALIKSFIVFLLLILLLPLASSSVFAQTKIATTSSTNTSTDSNVPNNLHNWTQSVMIEVMSSLSCQLAGIDSINPNQACLGANQKTGKIGFLPSAQKGGAVGFMGTMIASLYTPPLHTSDYFQNLASNFGVSKRAYAATGTGFDSLFPLMETWSAFRNITYLVLVIVFVVIGLAIMLRVKIDPRTVMTIQNQIPKIIIGIIAITFSFAIAGFLIDIMWTLIYLIYGIFSKIQGFDLTSFSPSSMQTQSVFEVASHMASGGIYGIANNVTISVKDIFQHILNIDSSWVATFNPLVAFNEGFDPAKRSIANFFIDGVSYITGITTFLTYNSIKDATVAGLKDFAGVANTIPFIGKAITGLANAITSFSGVGASAAVAYTVYVATQNLLRNWLPYIIVYIVILFALVVALFRLWLSLLMAYIQILLDVVLAPFWIIGGIIPGSPISFSGWLKDIGANLLSFPATIAMLMLGNVFMSNFQNNTTGQYFIPPLIGNVGEPGLFGSLIGLGVILLTPNIVNMLKQLLKAPKSDMMAQVMKGVEAGGAVPMSGIKTGTAFLSKTPEMGKRGGFAAAFQNILR